MNWVLPYYNKKGEWFGPTGIFAEYRARASAIGRLCGHGRKRVLELGAGGGGTAAAMADLGHEVVAIEVSPVRAAHIRKLAKTRPKLNVIEDDFFIVQLEGHFDVVVYWDSFGVGEDQDQRRLLHRVDSEWLSDDGSMLMEVFFPWVWAKRAGKEERLTRISRLVEGEIRTVALEVPLKVRYDFDAVLCRFSDVMWPVGNRDEAIRQSIRCYTPADLLLLLEGTGLWPDYFEVNGEAFTLSDGPQIGAFMDAEKYLVRLARDST